MAEHDHNCPFLNRADERCSEHFHLEKLQHAFAHCFDHFHACPVYIERVIERRMQRQSAGALDEQGDIHGRQISIDEDESCTDDRQLAGRQASSRQVLVQISIPVRYARRGHAYQAQSTPDAQPAAAA